ncbi:PIN domain-containing protein [bacterium CPR1]|nr:PIN domain-containing protein [bacterium CPR1]
MCAWHQDHARCRRAWVDSIAARTPILAAAHTLAEVYSVLTRLPPPHRLAPAAAHRLVQGNLQDKHIIELTAADYWSVLEECRAQGIAGGTVYDALIVRAALLGKATELLTLNASHFRRLAPSSLEVRSP